MEFNEYGNLNSGIIKIDDLKLVEEFLVDAFPESLTRKELFENFKEFLAAKIDWEVFSRVWIDGSFCSDKADPRDIDCVLFFNPLHHLGDEVLKIKQQKLEIENEYSVDFYIVPDKEFISRELEENNFPTRELLEVYGKFDYQEKYWMGQFGFDRNRNPKGIIEFEKEALIYG